MKHGAQLYTTRETMQTPEGIRQTLARVAQIGYRYIQLSGFAFDAAAMKALCDELGLQVVLTHTPQDRILNETAQVIAEHKLLGCPNVGIGSMPGEYRGSLEGARKFLADYTPAMQAFRDAVLKFQYHNHSFEFERFGGNDVWSVLTLESDPALLGFTLDTYWVQHGGKNVVDTIQSLRGRIDVCHYKDLAMHGSEQRFAAIGQGNLDWQPIFAAFEDIGTQYAFVEEDDCYGADPLDELETSFRFLEG